MKSNKPKFLTTYVLYLGLLLGFWLSYLYLPQLPKHWHQKFFFTQIKNPLSLTETNWSVHRLLKHWHEDSFVNRIDFQLSATDTDIVPQSLQYNLAVIGLREPIQKSWPSPHDVLRASITVDWNRQKLILDEALLFYLCCNNWFKHEVDHSLQGNSTHYYQEARLKAVLEFDILALAEQRHGKRFRQQYCMNGCDIGITYVCGFGCPAEIGYLNRDGKGYRLFYDYLTPKIQYEQLNEIVIQHW